MEENYFFSISIVNLISESWLYYKAIYITESNFSLQIESIKSWVSRDSMNTFSTAEDRKDSIHGSLCIKLIFKSEINRNATV